MMKKLIFTFLIFLSLNAFSQGKGEIKIAKNKLKDLNTIRDIVKDIPADCQINQFFLSINVGGQLVNFSFGGEAFSFEAKTAINNSVKGQKFYIENINSSCPKSLKIEYKIIVY